MTVGFIGLIALAGLAAVVFLAVLGLITLLTNPKTRDVAKILLGGLAAMTLLVVLVGGMFLGVSRREAVRREATVTHLRELGQQVHNNQAFQEILVPDAPDAADRALPPPDPRTRTAIGDATESDELKAPEEAGDEAADTQAKSKAKEATEPEETPAEMQEPVAEKPEPVAEESKSMPEVAEAVTEEAATDAEEPQDSETAELSVAPLPDAPNRPAWVDRKPYKEGSVYCWPVATDPRPDVLEAEEEALPIALDGAVADYVKDKLKLGSLASRRIHLAPDYVRNKLVGEDIWIEPHRLSMGEFVQMHALVKFDFEANSIIRDQWDKQRLVGRLWSAGGFLALVLLFLSLIYCYLKIDQVTAGSRRGLLRFAAVLVILGLMLVAAGVASVGIA